MLKIAAFLLTLLFASEADAATRSYSFPQTSKTRIGTCLADGTSCGKVAADAFCKKEGFTESILFAREPAASVRILDSDAMCEVQACEAFVKIKCYQPVDAAAG